MTVAPGQPGFPQSRMAEKHRRSSLWLWNTAAAGHRGIRTEKRLATASGATVAIAPFSLSYNCNLLIQSPSVGNAAAAPTGSVNGVPSYHRAPASIECCVNRGAVRRPLLSLYSTMLCPLQASFFLHIQYRFAISCQQPENTATAFLIIRKKNVAFTPKNASAHGFPALCTARDQCPLVALRPMMPTRSRHTKMARRGNIASLKSSMPTTTDPSAPMPVQIA